MNQNEVLDDVRTAIREGATEDQPVSVRRRVLDFVVDRLTRSESATLADLESTTADLRRQLAGVGDELLAARLELRQADEEGGIKASRIAVLELENQRLKEAADRTPREPAAPGDAGAVAGAIDRLIDSLKVGDAIDRLAAALERQHGETLAEVRELVAKLPPR